MVKGGGDAGVDGLLRNLVDLDEDMHSYKVDCIVSPSEGRRLKKKQNKKRNETVFNSDADKPIFRTIRMRNGSKRVVQMHRRMRYRPANGNTHKRNSKTVKRIFSDHRLMDADVKASDL